MVLDPEEISSIDCSSIANCKTCHLYSGPRLTWNTEYIGLDEVLECLECEGSDVLMNNMCL